MRKDERNTSEILYEATIQAAQERRVLFRKDANGFSWAVACDALQFYVKAAHWLVDLSCGGLHQIAVLRRHHPEDWKFRVQLREYPRLMYAPRFAEPPARENYPIVSSAVILGRWEDVLPRYPDNCVDTVFTSPPYANRLMNLFPGVTEADYPAYTVNWATAVGRLLKPRGNLAIVICPHTKGGDVSDYVLKTILAMKAAGWLWRQRQVWHKPDAPPIGSSQIMRDAFEDVLWFARQKDSVCYPTACSHPFKGFGVNVSKRSPRFKRYYNVSDGTARHTNVARIPVSGNDHAKYNLHPAQYPVRLPQHYLPILTPQGGMVLDLFGGSGTTAVAAIRCGMRYLSIEVMETFYRGACRRVKEELTHHKR